MARKKKTTFEIEGATTPPEGDVRLFHGTSTPFGVGDVILPRSRTGAFKNDLIGREDLAYATPDMEKAIGYAQSAANWMEDRAKRLEGTPGEGTLPKPHPYVYEVQPIDPSQSAWVERQSRSGVFKEHVSPEGYQVIRNAWKMKRAR